MRTAGTAEGYEDHERPPVRSTMAIWHPTLTEYGRWAYQIVEHELYPEPLGPPKPEESE